MAKTSPTQRTLQFLRKCGTPAEVVEKWVPGANIRRDFAGCIDIIAYGYGIGIIGIQATSRTNHAARRKKAMEEPRLREWLRAGGTFELWSWKCSDFFGKRRWQVLREQIRFEGDRLVGIEVKENDEY